MKEESINLFCAVFLGVILAVPGVARNMDRTVLTSQSYISQAAAADTFQVDPTAEFTQKEFSKKRFRTLWNVFKSEPLRLSRRSG